MQVLLSHPYREIVSHIAMGGCRDDGNPISIWTITLPSGLAVHLFQFDWLGEPRSPKQPAQPLYSGHQAQEGVEGWCAWSSSVESSSCSGLNMLTPLKLAHHPRRVWILLRTSKPLLMPVRLSVFLVSALLCVTSVLMYDHNESRGGSKHYLHPHPPTILLGTALFFIRTDRLLVCLFTAPSPFSRLLLSPHCQLDTQGATMQNHGHAHMQSTHLNAHIWKVTHTLTPSSVFYCLVPS